MKTVIAAVSEKVRRCPLFKKYTISPRHNYSIRHFYFIFLIE